MSMTTSTGLDVSGYCIGRASVQYEIAPEQERNRARIPVVRSTTEVLHILSVDGFTTTSAGSFRPDQSKPARMVSSGKMLGLVMIYQANGAAAIAFKYTAVGQVVPAVLLRSIGGRWDAQALAIYGDGLKEATSILFESASVAALLALTENAFCGVFANPLKAASRLDYLCAAGDMFEPREVDQYLWEVASRWPNWQSRRLNMIARYLELHREPGIARASEEAFRQKCYRMGLRIHDGGSW